MTAILIFLAADAGESPVVQDDWPNALLLVDIGGMRIHALFLRASSASPDLANP